MKHRFLSSLTCAAGAFLIASQAFAAPVASGNLLTNPGFESGLSGWTAVTGTATPTVYGTAGQPSAAVSSAIGGGGTFLQAGSGNPVVRQLLAVGSTAPGTNVKASGFFGGVGTGSSRLVLRFADAGGATLGPLVNLDPITREDRNFENVLMYREQTFALPPNTTSIEVRLEFINVCCSTSIGAADNLDVQLVTAPATPPPIPLNTEMLVNRNFESGWAPGSPLVLTSPQGWYGVNGNTVVVKPYSDVDSTVPNTVVSCQIGGGLAGSSCSLGGAGNLLADQGGGAVRQRIDVRGNASSFASFGSVALSVEAYLGGVLSDTDSARVDVRFLNASLVNIAPLQPVGPVTREQRNFETVVARRRQEFLIPTNTSYIEIDVAFSYSCCSLAAGLADNISAKLVTPSTPSPIPLGVNLVRNGNFAQGSIAGSPLQLTALDGWYGVGNGNVRVVQYGSSTQVPPASFSAGLGLGGQLLSDFGGAGGLEQVFDLTGSQAAVNSGVINVSASTFLGGFSSDTDSAELRIRFEGSGAVPLGTLVTLGPVTPQERLNVTELRPKAQEIQVPVGAQKMYATLLFNYSCCSAANGLADGISLVAYNTVTPTTNYFCLGDAQGTACPCGNNTTTIDQAGCRNSLGLGGRLTSTGLASMTADTLALVGSQLPNGPSLYFQALSMSEGGNGNVFGDGLRCAAGGVIRLGVKANVANTSQYPTGADLSISQKGAISTPGIRTYQTWYRDSAAFCTSSTFNLTNGWQVIWAF